MPPDTLFQGDLGLKQHGLMTEGEEKFKRERAAFLKAAQSEAGPPKRLLARRRR